jgi:hypothetical protein
LLELERKFEAVSCETQVIHGIWRHAGKTYHDALARAFVDVEDTPEHRQFFVLFKEQLKQRFQQEDIWLTTFPIELI